MCPIISSGGSSGGGVALARNVGQVELEFAQDVTDADGQKHLTLTYSAGDATMVSLTDPANPTVVAAGVYAFNLTGNPGATDNQWGLGVLVDDAFYSLLAVPVAAGISTAAAAAWWCSAGDPFAAIARNLENVTPGALHFIGRLLVQRVA